MKAKIYLSGLAIILFGFGFMFFVSTEREVSQNISPVVEEVTDFPQVREVEVAEVVADTSVEVFEAITEQQPKVDFAPDFSLPSLDQTSTFALRSFAGEKPVIVDFFAAHCPNCRRNLPKLEELYAQYGDQVEVVLIGIDSFADTQRYFTNNPTDIPVVMTNNRVLVDYAIRFTNTKALINRDGSLLEIVEYRDIVEEDFLRLIES